MGFQRAYKARLPFLRKSCMIYKINENYDRLNNLISTFQQQRRELNVKWVYLLIIVDVHQ